MSEKSTYNVDIQPRVHGQSASVFGPMFTVQVEAADLAQAERRGLRKAVQNAAAYNDRHEDSFDYDEDLTPRSIHTLDYRAVGARLAHVPSAPARVTAPVVKPSAPEKVLITLDVTAVVSALQANAI